MKKLALIACVLGLTATAANAVPLAPKTQTVIEYATIGAVVGAVAGGIVCLGHPACIILGSKLTALGGAAVGTGVGAGVGGGAAIVTAR